MLAQFTKTNDDGEIECIEHFFSEKEPRVFFNEDCVKIREEFDKFIEKTKDEIEDWSKKVQDGILKELHACT